MSAIHLKIYPDGGTRKKEKQEYTIRADNEADWFAAPIVHGDLQVSLVKDPEQGQIYLKFANPSVRDKRGEAASYARIWGTDVNVTINPKHVSPSSMEQLSKTPAAVSLKPKRVLSDEEKEQRAAKARATREKNKLKKEAEEKAKVVTLGD